MARTLAMFTDTSLCIGCRACQVACKQWNELGQELPGPADEAVLGQAEGGVGVLGGGHSIGASGSVTPRSKVPRTPTITIVPWSRTQRASVSPGTRVKDQALRTKGPSTARGL